MIGAEKDNQDAIHIPQPTHRSAFTQFANAKRGKDVIHLHEDEFEEGNQTKKSQQSIKARLLHELNEQANRIFGTIPSGEPERLPQGSVGIFLRFRLNFSPSSVASAPLRRK